MNQKRKEIFDKLKLKHPKATDQVVERMMSKMLKISKKDANTVKVEKNRNPSDVKVEDEPDKVAPYQLDDVDAEQASENHIESVQDIDDEMDDDEDHQEKPTKKNGKNEYLDFKKILVHELGPKMRQQIKKIEHDEQNDTEDEADDLKVNVKKEQTKKAKSLQDHAGKAIIEEIHQQIPEFEVDLIEELLKYDDNVVFVGDVPSHLDNRKIMQIFRQFGPIRSVRIRGFTGQKNIEKKLAGIQKKVDPNQKLIAYIVYEDVASAEKAIEHNQKALGAYKFRITKANHFEKRSVHKVVLRNLPPRTNFVETRKIITDFLTDCGSIVQVKAFREKPTDAHFSTALVGFDSPDAAQLALRKSGQSVGRQAITVQNHNERIKLGYKQKSLATQDEATGRPVHKKKLLKKRLREAKQNGKTAMQKVAYARKRKPQL